jgi:hypothetical protein
VALPSQGAQKTGFSKTIKYSYHCLKTSTFSRPAMVSIRDPICRSLILRGGSRAESIGHVMDDSLEPVDSRLAEDGDFLLGLLHDASAFQKCEELFARLNELGASYLSMAREHQYHISGLAAIRFLSSISGILDCSMTRWLGSL